MSFYTFHSLFYLCLLTACLHCDDMCQFEPTVCWWFHVHLYRVELKHGYIHVKVCSTLITAVTDVACLGYISNLPRRCNLSE